MAASNRREIREVLSQANLPYHLVKGSEIHVLPPSVTENGDQTVVLYDVDGNPLLILAPDMAAGVPRAFKVTPASVLIVAANPNRTALTLVNISNTAINLAFDGNAAALNAGITLNSGGGTVTLSRWGPLFTTGEVRARHTGVGNKIITIQEFN